MVFPFLKLPRELRDEIYAYVLLFDPPPLADPVYTDCDLGPYKPPEADLALLRVNRQVHEEAVPVFYGQNVFTIRILARTIPAPENTAVRDHERGSMIPAPEDPMERDHKRGFMIAVDCELPWERLCIGSPARVGTIYMLPARWRSDDYSRYELAGSSRTCPSRVFGPPANRYYNLIRHVRVDIFNFATFQNRRLQPHLFVDYHHRFMFVTQRLRWIFAGAGKNLAMQINLLGGRNIYIGSPFPGEPLYRYIYKRLFRVMCSLTRGPWKYAIQDSALDRLYPGVREWTLRKCARDPVYSEVAWRKAHPWFWESAGNDDRGPGCFFVPMQQLRLARDLYI